MAYFFCEEVNTLRKRSIRVGVRFNQSEHERFQKLVEDSGLSQEEYLRQLVRGVVPRDAPPPDYYKMMRQLYHIGNLLNQIAKKAHVLNVMDVKRYDEAVAELKQSFCQRKSEVSDGNNKDMGCERVAGESGYLY